MTRWHNYYIDGHPHFCTATVQDWECIFFGDAIQVVYEEGTSARELLGVKILAYIIMPNHIHIILWAEKGESISQFLRRTQSSIARRLRPSGGLWKERPHALAISSSSVIRTKVDYMHRNPIRAELVENPEDWEHSSYRQLVLGKHNLKFICDVWDGLSV
jgi:REP element-mobilizing transposase RayT